MIPVLYEQKGQNFISDDEEDEPEPEPEPQQVQARTSENTCLRSELKILSTSYNQEATKDWKGLEIVQISPWN